MADELVQLTLDDYENAVDFLNLVFSAHHPIDFERLLPKLYHPTEERMSRNYAIKRNGKIRAIVGLFPLELRIGNEALSVAGIGGVSVHPKDRGAGHMKRLMNHCVGLIKEQGYALSWLGGQRQRYAYFGYEICGSAFEFTMNRSNLRHCYPTVPDVGFERVTSADDALIPHLLAWHDSAPIRCTRDADTFFDVATSWHTDLMVATSSTGEAIGYAVVDPRSGNVAEFAGRSDADVREMTPALVARPGVDSAQFILPAYRSAAVDELIASAEYSRVVSTGNWQVFDWERVVGSLLTVRAQHGGLLPGRFVLEIEHYGRIRMEVDAGHATCERTTDVPQLTLTAAEAMRTLFGPLPPVLAPASVIASWWPLPLGFSKQDGV